MKIFEVISLYAGLALLFVVVCAGVFVALSWVHPLLGLGYAALWCLCAVVALVTMALHVVGTTWQAIKNTAQPKEQ